MPNADDVFCGDLGDLWSYWCIEEIKFYWDQWAGCVIECPHGRYLAEADGLVGGMGQSLERAYQKFLKDREKHDQEL
jgi:hypothetical protein